MNRKNIFIVHSSYQLFLSVNLARQFEYESENYLILEGDNYELDNQNIFKKVFTISKTDGKWFGYRYSKKINNELDNILNQLEINNTDYLFLSDIAWSLNNFIFTKYVLNKKIKLNFFEDGMANYVNITVNFSTYIKQNIKKFFSFLHLSLPSTTFKGHFLGCDHFMVEKIYGIDVNSLSCETSKRKKIKIYKNNNLFKRNNNTVLILDQPWVKFFGETIVKTAAKKVKKFLLENEVNRVYVKHHPRDILGNDGFAQYINLLNKNSINSNLAAEELLIDYECGIVISFNSTALMNIRRIDHHIKCYAVVINTNQIQPSKHTINYEKSLDVLIKNNVSLIGNL